MASAGAAAAGPEFVRSPVRSIEWDFPILEWRPLREYGTVQLLEPLIQFGAGFDTAEVDDQSLLPGQPVPPLKTRYFGFRAGVLRRPPLLLRR